MGLDLGVDPFDQGTGLLRIVGREPPLVVGEPGHMESVAVPEGGQRGDTVGRGSLGPENIRIAVGSQPLLDLDGLGQDHTLPGVADYLVIDDDDRGPEALSQIEGADGEIEHLPHR